jgi:hypothetical protein
MTDAEKNLEIIKIFKQTKWLVLKFYYIGSKGINFKK